MVEQAYASYTYVHHREIGIFAAYVLPAPILYRYVSLSKEKYHKRKRND